MNPLPTERLLFETRLAPGENWSHVLKRGTTLRITDLEGGGNVPALFLNFELPAERYNMPDTLKGQHTFFLTTGNVLYSDMGRVLVSVTGDDVGWHDTVCGPSTPETVRAQFGEARYQEHRNEFFRNARDGFLMELAKYDLGARDLMANVNFFSKVTADEDGALRFHPGHSAPGSAVELRAEMNTLVVLNACPHPLESEPAYPRRSYALAVWRSDPPGFDDACRTSCEQNQRAFVNTERYFL